MVNCFASCHFFIVGLSQSNIFRLTNVSQSIQLRNSDDATSGHLMGTITIYMVIEMCLSATESPACVRIDWIITVNFAAVRAF